MWEEERLAILTTMMDISDDDGYFTGFDRVLHAFGSGVYGAKDPEVRAA